MLIVCPGDLRGCPRVVDILGDKSGTNRGQPGKWWGTSGEVLTCSSNNCNLFTVLGERGTTANGKEIQYQ